MGIGGNYLAEPHTAEHFRDELFFSTLFETVPWATAHSPGVRGMENRAREQAREIWDEEPTVVLDRDQARAIDQIVARAAQELLP